MDESIVVVYAVRPPDGGPIYLPYSGALGAGSKEAAEHVVAPNRHLGWEVAPCRLVPIEE